MKKYLIISVLIFLVCSTFSQTDEFSDLKKWQLMGYGKSAERIGDTYSAIDFYSEYFSRTSENADLNYKLAVLYFDIKNYESAKSIFLNLIKLNDRKYYKSVFYYAKILKTEEKFDSAILYFDKYKESVTEYEKGFDLNLNYFKINKEIEGCEYADNYSGDKSKIQLIHLNKTINKAHMESAPILWNDTTFIYSSMMVDTLPIVYLNSNTKGPMSRFYMAKLSADGWQGSFKSPEPFFSVDSLHCSNGVFSDDNRRFYFTVSYDSWDGKKISSIYVSKNERGKWKEPTKLDERINLKNYTSTQPAVGKCYNPDYDVLYFVSDRPGGTGGLDIWYSIYDKVKGVYKIPFNAGSYINTPGNEITPFFDIHTKSLYFSSDGYPGIGGYDIYKSIGELINWIPSENLGRPFNSGYDDIYYSHSKEREQGFIVSNRSESTVLKSPHCCFDIFEYKIFEDNLSEISGFIFETKRSIHEKLKEKNSVQDNDNHTADMASVNTLIELHIENKNNGELIFIQSDTTNLEGKFTFSVEDRKNYQLSIYKEGFSPTKIKFNTNSTDKLVVFDPVTIIPVENSPLTLENIYFEYNQWVLSNNSKLYIDSTLIVAMNTYKDIVIEVSAHTDNTGSTAYNLELSKNRAESVEDYIITKGINPSRIMSIGYGETKPLVKAENDSENSIKIANDKNRRIEFRVIGLMISDDKH